MRQNIKVVLRRKFLLYRRRLSVLFRISIVFFVCIFIFTDLFSDVKNDLEYAFHRFCIENGFALTNITIHGHDNAPLSDISEIMEEYRDRSIFAVDIVDIHKQLITHEWIIDSIVARRLPSTIDIVIIEKIPVAVWQYKHKLHLIDREGDIISSKDIEEFSELLHVVGQDANIYAQSLIKATQVYPILASKLKSAVRYGQRRWNLNFDQQITVKMPEEQFDTAYSYLNSLNKKNRLFDHGYKVLDLRNAEKYYFEKY